MKDYHEMAESVLKRRDAYVIKRKQEIRKMTTVVSGFCICAVLGFGLWQSGVLKREPVQESISTEAVRNEHTNSTQQKLEESTPKQETMPVENFEETKQKENLQETLSSDIGSALLAPPKTDLTKEEIYEQISEFLPDSGPEGFVFEEAFISENSYYIRWARGMEELSWWVKDYKESDAAYITDVADTENYDLSLYPIPRAESVPPALQQIVNNPIFYGYELTKEAVNARAYLANEMGDSKGYRMDFSVLYGDKIVRVNSKGVTPDWMYEKLSFIYEANKGSDVPVQDEAGDTGALNTYEEVWGGSYMNASGNWVVWLTEDTPDNRAEVFRKNPNISNSSTEFKKADYSLTYLTQLMADISKAMGNKELQGVSSAALREDINRVEVSMTEENQDIIAKITAMDTIGGAVEYRYGAFIINDDIQKEN